MDLLKELKGFNMTLKLLQVGFTIKPHYVSKLYSLEVKRQDLANETAARSLQLALRVCLQETRIGMSVNGIRKHCTDEEVIALAKVLIKDWKRLLGTTTLFI